MLKYRLCGIMLNFIQNNRDYEIFFKFEAIAISSAKTGLD